MKIYSCNPTENRLNKTNIKKVSIFLTAIILFIFSFSLLIPSTIAQSEGNWSEPQKISVDEQPGTVWIEYTDLVADKTGRLHAFWESAPGSTKGSSGEFSIYYTYMDTNGVWQTPIDIIIGARYPVVQIDSRGYLHLFYSTDECLMHVANFVLDAYKTREWNNSSQCIGPKQISQYDAFIDMNDVIHVAFADIGNGTLVYIYSDDNGENWSDQNIIAVTKSSSEALADIGLNVDQFGTIHAAWSNYPLPDAFPPLSLWYSNSNDDGKNWSNPIQIAQDHNLQPRLLSNNDQLHVIWNGAVKLSVRYHRYKSLKTDDWSYTQAWISTQGGVLGHPDGIFDSSGVLHAVGATDMGAWYASFENGTWSPAEQIYRQEFQTGNPSVAIVLGNKLHVIFRSGVDSVWHTWRQLNLPGDEPQSYTNTMPFATKESSNFNNSGFESSPQPSSMTQISSEINNNSKSFTDSPAFLVGIGLLPILFIILVVIIVKFGKRRA